MQVNYHDLSSASVREQFPNVMQRVRTGDLALPAVFLDEEIVSLGFVDYFSIARAIQAARGNGHQGR